VVASTLGVLALVAALAFALRQAREKTHEAAVSQQVTAFLVGLFKGADPALSRGASVSAQDLLDQGTERLRSDAHIEPTVRARLLQTVATTYTDLGLYDRALPLAQQALMLRRHYPARADAEVAESLDELGRILRLKADYAQAEPLLRSALAMRRALLPVDDPAVIESLDHLAALKSGQGRFKEADALLAEAVHSAQRHYGGEAVETARYLDNYAGNLDDMGKRVDALALYWRALDIREKKLGAGDAEVATSLLNLGVHLDESGDYDEAVPLLERSVAIRKKIYGAAHPLVGFAEIGLASVYADVNRPDAAQTLAEHALAIFRATLPATHPKISEALNMLVVIHVGRRDFASAVPLAREVLARFRSTLGATHPNTLTAMNNLAYALSHSGQWAEAERLQRDVLAQHGSSNGQIDAALDCENLASTLIREGKYTEAVIYERNAVTLQRQREGVGSANTAIALRELGTAEELAGRSADAERDFRAALAIGEKLAQAHKIDMFNWKVPLADFLIGADRCAEAVPLLESSKAEFDRAHGVGDPVRPLEIHLLLGHCRATGPRRAEGEGMQRTARAQLRALPGIEMDLDPVTRKLLSTPR
jgi:serine/threonine-protein kinase